jgi:hypothetical protein
VTHSRLAKICSITYTQSPTPSRDKKGILQQFLRAGGHFTPKSITSGRDRQGGRHY